MNVHAAVFTGLHRGRAATITFQRVMGQEWKITMVVAGKKIIARASSKSIKPCMTHAGYLLTEHFPLPLDALKTPRKPNEHRAAVVDSAFVETKTGMRFRVVK
jgi:hypothetical protein